MSAKTKFPLYSPGLGCDTNNNKELLIIDLRPDTSFAALANCKDGEVTITKESKIVTTNYSSFSALADAFRKKEGLDSVRELSVAVPGPVIDGMCKTPNLPWEVSKEVVEKELGFSKVHLINDLEAVAYSLSDVYDDKFEIIYKPESKRRANVAILAPGNGLGEAGLYYDGEFLRPFATEGGHTEFSPRDDFEVQFYQFLKNIYGIVTWENVLSKKGLYNIYRFLRDIGRHEEEPWLRERVEKEDFLHVVSSVAREQKSRLVKLTMAMFLDFLAREANSMVLKLKATGGLIITGEIMEEIYDLIDKERFYKNFMISDRMEHLLKDIPIYILRNKKGILEGAAYYGAFYEDVDNQ